MLAISLGAAGTLHAAVEQSAPDGFLLALSMQTRAQPSAVYAALAKPQTWWSDDHTWSGKATNLSFAAEAGGCWCERWAEGSAQHGRVLMALPGRMLRIETALGPLQEFALHGVLTYWIRAGEGEDAATTLDLEYRVNGSSASGLDAGAADVDAVLTLQLERLWRYLETGNPAPPAEPEEKDASSHERAAAAAERAAILEAWRKSAEQEAAAAKKKRAQEPKPPKP